MFKRNPYPFFISFLLLTAVIILNRNSFSKMKAYTGSVDHTQQVIAIFERLSNDVKSAEIYSPSYASSFKGSFYASLEGDIKDIRKGVIKLHELTSDMTFKKQG